MAETTPCTVTSQDTETVDRETQRRAGRDVDECMAFQEEIVASALIGVFGGGILLYFLQKYPGKPFRYDIIEEEEESSKVREKRELKSLKEKQEREKKEKENNYTVQEALDQITEESVLKKTARLRKVLGINETTVRQAVRKTKEDAKNGISIEDNTNYMKVADWTIFLFALIVVLYFANYATKGHVYRILYGLFPVEFQAFNFPRPK